MSTAPPQLGSGYDFSYEFRIKNPDSPAAQIANRLIGNMFEQTYLVEELFRKEIFQWGDVQNLYADCGDCEGCTSGSGCDEQPSTEIFQWAAYPAMDIDRERLDKAGIPYIYNDYGTWIGITSFGTAWDVYVAASLCDALYND